jgi:hypothetical protein
MSGFEHMHSLPDEMMEPAARTKRRFLNIDAVLTPEREYQQWTSFVDEAERAEPIGEGKENEPAGVVELLDVEGEILLRHQVPVAPVCAHPVDGGQRLEKPLLAFSGQVPYHDQTRTVRVLMDAEPVFELDVPPSAPTVQWKDAEEVEGRLRLSWAAESSSKTPLQHMLYIERPESKTRLPVIGWTSEQELEFDAAGLPGGNVILVLITTDGVNTTETRTTLERPPQPPVLVIVAPSDGEVIPTDTPTRLVAAAHDADSDFRPLRFVEWSSSQDGLLGCGRDIEVTLSEGKHELTVTGRADEREASTQISVAVGIEAILDTARVYRRRRDSDVWHWCANCSNWPYAEYRERDSKPQSGELCNECRSKERSENCEPAVAAKT